MTQQDNYCIYLRKSRADLDAEQRGEGETLARHERILLDLANRMHLHIGAIYKEIVSGESIQNRPVMQQLLQEVSAGTWSGVLVVEVERLARGDTEDQGAVAKAFKYSNTKIITPAKTYDPNDEFDEEYFEFGLFMSRREYKTIKRRMQSGRSQASKEGKWVGNKAPYGYDIIKLENGKGFTLTINQEEASVYQMIITASSHGINGIRYGDSANARRLNELGIKTRTGKQWTASAVNTVRTNPTHAGKIVWGRRKQVKQMVDGKVINTRPRNNDVEMYQGLHPALIDYDTWLKAQEPFIVLAHQIKGKDHVIQSPISGIVKCAHCGRNMVRRPYQRIDKEPTLICPHSSCNNISTKLSLVENAIVATIKSWVADYEISEQEVSNEHDLILSCLEKQLSNQTAELDGLRDQLNKLYTFLETGVYDTNTFIERSTFVKKQIEHCEIKLNELSDNLKLELARKHNQDNFIPLCKKLIDNYDSLCTADKNAELKLLIDHVNYSKMEKNKKGEGHIANFSLEVFPRIPHI